MLSKFGSRFSQRRFRRRLASKAPIPQGKRASAGPVAEGTERTSFAVDSVTPATDAMATEMLAESLAFRLQRNILALPWADQPVIDEFPPRRVNVEIRTPKEWSKSSPKEFPGTFLIRSSMQFTSHSASIAPLPSARMQSGW